MEAEGDTDIESTMSTTAFEGPFLTDFAPADGCSQIKDVIVDGGYILDLYTDSNCLPSDFNTVTSAYYSPGTACPTGYTA